MAEIDFYMHIYGAKDAVNVEELPSADVVERKHGKWNRTDAYPHRLYCSVCYKTYLKNDELLERWEFPINFCPNCGAKMTIIESEEEK